MKKVLLSLCMCSLAVFGFAQEQVVINENFDALNLGNVGTDFTGTTAGQGGIYLYGGSAASYQIINIDVPHGKSLQLTSGNGAPPASGANTNERWAWKNISTTASATNDITVIQAQIFTGPATGAGTIKVILYGPIGASSSTIGGIKYNYATKTIQGEANVSVPSYPPSGTSGTLTLTLGTQVFPANTWVNVEYRYNKTTGAHKYIYSDGTNTYTYDYTGGNVTIGGTAYPAVVVPNLVAAECDIVSTTAAGNTVENIASVDNFIVKFSNSTLLSTSEVSNISKASFFIYPNPTVDIINIKTDKKIKSFSIIDFSGRVMDAKNVDNKIDVSHLQSGTYILSVETSDGIVSEKFIKK